MAGTPLREILASFGIEVNTAELQRGMTSIDGAIDAVTGLGRALAGSAIVVGIQSLVQGMIDTGSELHDTSTAMGISATELAGWRHAAGMAGVDAGQLSGALSRVAVIARSHEGVFRRLGVTVRDANGEYRSASDLLADVGTAIGSIDNETERTAAAVQIFGRSGRALIPLFGDGAESVAAMREEVRALYGTDLDRLAEVADEAGDAQDRLSLRLDAVRTRLALLLVPALTEALDLALGWSTAAVQAARNSEVFTAALAVLGAVGVAAAIATAGAWGPPLLVFLAYAIAIGVVIGLVDDLLVLFAGGESVIGDFIDELFGVGTAEAMVARLRAAFGELVEFWSGDGVDGMTAGFDRLQARMAEVFAFWEESFGRISTAMGEAADFWGDVFGAGEEAIARTTGAASEVATGFREAAAGPTSVSLSTGPIMVSGSGDPLETARAVDGRTRERFGEMAADVADDLLPAVG